ncbi:MAG: glycoside hydrolase family 43 protein [Planctomycetota bacterium]
MRSSLMSGNMQLEANFGGTFGVSQMILQSHPESPAADATPVIHLLPALPDAWPHGEIRGWRAQGGWIVDISWQDGVIDKATLRATRGGPVTVRYGQKTVNLDAVANQEYRCDGSLDLQARIGSWGDQGDGTYRNPILNADYPDVDVEQLGDTYYMISSKQHMSPGMVILQSKDMVNWQTVDHVWDKLSWDPKYDWNRMDGYRFGVWAGDLAYHDGRWYCYQIDTTNGLYMSSAEDIRGPWTKPHRMLKKTGWTDPAVYWDDAARQAYLVCNFGRGPGGNQIKLFRMSWDGRALLDKGTVIHRGPGAEAAKIYRIDGRWYIFLAQWFRPDPRRPTDEASSGDRKQLVLRSKTDSIYGPYEVKVVYERGNGVIRSCSQGALMKAPDGSWWYTHQLIQNIPAPFQGRPQMLQPVKWIDGWPMIGKDVDGDGIGEPILHHPKPILGHPIAAPPTDDEFDAATRGPQWEWNHNPRDTRCSLTERPGWLRLKASAPVKPGGFWGACNTISQRLMGTGKGRAEAKFDLVGMKPGQRAGFVRFGGVYHLLGVQVDGDGTRRLFFDANGTRTAGPVINGETLWIRTTNDGDRARFAWSSDGGTFHRLGPTFTIKFGMWTGDRLGFFCWNEKTDDPAVAGHVDVDWFRYDYDGPKQAIAR